MELDSLYSTLNNAQKEVVFHDGEQPLLVLAGAGSGKTRVITLRMAYLVQEKGLKGSSILGFTFTNKAANEMRERVEKWLGASSGIQLRTFHSFGAWFLRIYASLAGGNENFSIWDTSDVISALKALASQGKIKNLVGEENSQEESFSYKALASSLMKAKESFLQTKEELETEFWSIPSFYSLLQAYEGYRKNSNAFDFADLIKEPLLILKKYPDVKERIHSRFKAIFVDEYQDTNKVQFLLLKELIGEDTLLCAVGDEDQCIYGFRGARLENILEFKDQFKGTKIVRLEENYRSSANIIKATSQVISFNKNRLGKNLFTNKEAGDKIAIYKHESSSSEARFWASSIAKKEIPTQSLAIIYRTNAQSLPFEKAFREAKIPYQIIGALRFYEREEIKDALAYLKAIANSQDQVSFLRIVNKPARGLGKKGLEVVINEFSLNNYDVWLSLKGALSHLPSKTRLNLEKLLEAVNHLRDDLHDLPISHPPSQNLGEAFSYFFKEIDLFGYYQRADAKELTEKSLNLEEFVASATEYNATIEELRNFLESTELAPEREEWQEFSSQKPIVLLTAHSSKGLEFQNVIISGMEEGLFPLSFSGMNTPEEIEEERRLFYVAMTRAQEKLSLSFCTLREARGKRFEVNFSPFLKELPDDIVRVFKIKDPLAVKTARKSFSYSGSYSKEKKSFSSLYSQGDLVFHSRWGEGEVLFAWKKQGEEYVRILFEDGQEKVLMPEYDKLEKI